MRRYINGKFWFDPETHTYGLGEQPLGGFSEVFKSLGLAGNNRFYTEEGRDRGQAVHLLCQAHDEGREIDISKIEDAKTLGRFQAYKRFREETGFLPDQIEIPVFNAPLLIACTPDRTGRLNDVLVIVDLKGGAKAAWHSWQTSWQGLCLFPDNAFNVPRYALYLKDSGRYKLEPHEDQHDFEVARSVAIVYNAKRSLTS